MAKKILYAIQGTGNGHLSRSMEIVPLLKMRGEVDVLVSGKQGDLELPFDVKYRCHGMGFVFGKSGGVDFWKSFQKADTRKFIKEINRLPVHKYDLIISDFEPVSAWACHFANKACIGLSHQVAVLNKEVPKPDTRDLLGNIILKQYAPVTAQYGFHFKTFSHNIFTPVIRQEVREQQIRGSSHYTVYLPAYDDERLIKKLAKFKHIEWQVFSKHNQKPIAHKNITIEPISNLAFIRSMASSQGILCGAGFETPAEALFMKKKLLVVPMKNQYEQQLNAAALKAMGVPVIKSLKSKYESTIQQWLDRGKVIEVNYPDQTQEIVDLILEEHLR